MKVMVKSGFVDLVGKDNFCPNIRAALEYAEKIYCNIKIKMNFTDN